MMIQCRGLTTKLKTKRFVSSEALKVGYFYAQIVFEDVLRAGDCATLEFLRELTAKRRPIEESINQTSSITEAIERERSGGLTSSHEQDLHKLEQYLPLLENLVSYVDSSSSDKIRIHEWISQLKIQWISALNSSSFLKPRSTTFYQINSLQFERGMCLFLYAGILRELALEVLSKDLVQSAKLLREAAGVYDFLASLVFPLLLPLLSLERPMETTHEICSVMGLVCLAEAQAVTIKKAEEKGTAIGLLAKLHFGVAQFLEEANVALQSGCRDLKQISSQFVDFISSSKALHELRGYRYLAESYRLADQRGIAIGLLSLGLNRAQKKPPEEEAWKPIFKVEVSEVTELHKRYVDENNFLSREKPPLEHELPPPECKKIVSYTPYQPQISHIGRELRFNV